MINRNRFTLLLLLFLILTNCSKQAPHHLLPQLVLPDHPEIVQLYRKAWDILYKHIAKGTGDNNFSRRYLDEGFDPLIHQWDTICMALFAVYGNNVFPVIESIDNFYNKQRFDGFISRAYWETTGETYHSPIQKDPMISIPLFTWAELKYYKISGDNSRFQRIFPILERYFHWIDRHCRSRNEASGLYYTSPLGSRMENLPREHIEFGAYVDLSAQMAIFAKDLSYIAELIGNESKSQYYLQKYKQISALIQKKLWDPENNFYYDMNSEGIKLKVKTIAGFWPLIASIPSEADSKLLIEHLKNPEEFNRPHKFPSLSADEPDYDPRGFHWRGGVWAPTNYMIIQGLHNYNELLLATDAAWNHISNMAYVLTQFTPDSSLVDSAYHNFPFQTIWESYSPEGKAPGTRWDAKKYGKPEYVGWSGLGPIAMVIEDILRLEIDGANDQITWRPFLTKKHGIKNLKFGNNTISLWCEEREKSQLPFSIHGKTDSPFILKIIIENETFTIQFDPGPIELTIMPPNYIHINRAIN